MVESGHASHANPHGKRVIGAVCSVPMTNQPPPAPEVKPGATSNSRDER